MGKFFAAHRHLGPRNLYFIDEAGKAVPSRMAVSLDVEVVLLDIGRFVPPLYFGPLSFKMKVMVKGQFSQLRSRVSQQS